MICESGPTVTHFRPCLETGGNWMHTRQPDTFTDNMEAVTCTHCLYLLRDRADRVDAEDGGRCVCGHNEHGRVCFQECQDNTTDRT